ncbi:MgtC/SapB family protein, partial [Vulcanococcus limneticus]|uniref:MgtC/SapB family protein n=1 Tax=Vulcanococcus limneticus TaxID=2170428 RepID=UPI00398BF486
MAYADPSHLFFSPDDWGEIFFRIGLAVLAGGAVGINRDRVKRPAGLRTYMTVSVGSAFFVMLILQAGVDFNATNALSRTVQGITTGVRADSKCQIGFSSGCRIAIARSAVMSCITACRPSRIESNPARRSRFRAAV